MLFFLEVLQWLLMTFRVKFMSLALRVACDTVSVSVPLYSHRASYIPVMLECSQVPKP